MEEGRKEKRRSEKDLLSPEAGENDDDELTELFSERVQNLSDAIDELDQALARRRRLSSKFLHQIEEEAKEVLRHIRKLNPPWKTGFHPELEFFRLSLHKSLTSRKKDKRSEELKYWEDVTGLVKDKRKLLDDYKALLSTKRRLTR